MNHEFESDIGTESDGCWVRFGYEELCPWALTLILLALSIVIFIYNIYTQDPSVTILFFMVFLLFMFSFVWLILEKDVDKNV